MRPFPLPPSHTGRSHPEARSAPRKTARAGHVPDSRGGSLGTKSLFREHDRPLFLLPDELACLRRPSLPTVPSLRPSGFLLRRKAGSTPPCEASRCFGVARKQGASSDLTFKFLCGESEVFEHGREVNMFVDPLVRLLFSASGHLRV